MLQRQDGAFWQIPVCYCLARGFSNRGTIQYPWNPLDGRFTVSLTVFIVLRLGHGIIVYRVDLSFLYGEVSFGGGVSTSPSDLSVPQKLYARHHLNHAPINSTSMIYVESLPR